MSIQQRGIPLIQMSFHYLQCRVHVGLQRCEIQETNWSTVLFCSCHEMHIQQKLILITHTDHSKKETTLTACHGPSILKMVK